MFFNLFIAKIDGSYCEYLRKYDNKVPFNMMAKQNRPFLGILFTIHNVEYFAPLSSSKEKHLKMHNTLDFVKIANGKLGAINFNNMVPVTKNNYQIIDLNKKTLNKQDNQYQELLKDQLSWLNKNYIQIIYKADNLYALYLANLLPENIKKRCCNFKLLEEKCTEYRNLPM